MSFSVAVRGVLAGIGFLAFARPALAQQDSARMNRLEAQLDAITRELETLRLGRDVVVTADTGRHGLGPAASKVYKVQQGVSLGGYGEVLYENFSRGQENGAPSGMTDRFDALRAILYVGYKFNDRLLFNSEIEVEHGGTEHGGSVALEFGYLEYRLWRRGGVRAGQVLIPMGLLNERHEPPAFLGAHRPLTETLIIPSTWHENGIGIFGEAGPIGYRAFVVNGFAGERFEATGLREGRQDGAEAVARHFGGAGRVELTVSQGVLLGTSGYVGNSGQSDSITARTAIWEAHAEFRRGPLELRGLLAMAFVDDAGRLNAVVGLVGSASIGKRLIGWYLQGGYDVLSHTRSAQQLIPYVRYEQVNTQDQVPMGFSADPANDRRVITLGAAWKPIPNIALKADYQIMKDAAGTGVNQLNAALGYLF